MSPFFECGVRVAESHHARDFSMPSESHAFWQLLYAFRGRGWVHLGRESFEFGARNAILLSPHTLHTLQDQTGAPLSLYVVNFAPALTDALQTLPRNFPLAHPALSARLPDTLRRLLWEQTTRGPGYVAMMNGQALQLLAFLARLQTAPASSLSTPQARVENYVADLKRSFHRAESVDQVAARLAMSRRHFTSLFRAATGTSWLAYVRRLRVQHAQRLLRESNRTVLMVAFECGWEDPSAFYRAFKSETGLGPDLWRKREQGEV